MNVRLPRVGVRSLALVVVAPALAGTVLAALIDPWAPPIAGRERLTAVLLLNGQAYFGHLVDVPWSETIELRDVYYFQDARQTTTGLQLGLVRRGTELHEPADGMTFRRDKVFVVEEISRSSPVRAAVAAERVGDRRDGLGAWLWPRAVADRSALEAQRIAAEHGVQRGYAKALARLDQVRQLTLAISASDAARISAKAVADLAAVRRSAVVALGTAAGMSAADLEAYVRATEARLDQAGDLSGEPGTLLAPSLFDVVRRADELFAQIADQATRDLTGARTPAPTAAPSPSPP